MVIKRKYKGKVFRPRPRVREVAPPIKKKLPTKTAEGKTITYYQGGAKPKVYGVHLIDPATLEVGQSVFLSEYRKKHPDEEMKEIEASKRLAEQKYRWEEKSYESQMAKKREEVEKVSIKKEQYQVEYKGKTYTTPDKDWRPKEYKEDVEKIKKAQSLGTDIKRMIFVKQMKSEGFTVTESNGKLIGKKDGRKKVVQIDKGYSVEVPTSAKIDIKSAGMIIEKRRKAEKLKIPAVSERVERIVDTLKKQGYLATGTGKGLIEIKKDGRKTIIDPSRLDRAIVADIPLSAKYTRGYESKLGTAYKPEPWLKDGQLRKIVLADIGKDISRFIHPAREKVKEISEKYDIGTMYRESEQWLSKKMITPTREHLRRTTYRDLTRVRKEKARLLEQLKEATGLKKKILQSKYGMVVAAEQTLLFEKGAVLGIRKKPLKAAVTAGAFFALPPVLKGVSKLGKVLKLGKIPGAAVVSKILGTTVKVGLPVVYGTSIYGRVKISKTPAETLGGITSTEIIPMMVGGYAGVKVWPKVGGYFATRGRTKVPIEKVVTADVLTGKTRFPEAGKGLAQLQRAKLHLRIVKAQKYALPGDIQKLTGSRYIKGKWVDVKKIPFKILRPEPYGYHATGEMWKISKGLKSQLYLSGKGISPHFLRISGKSSLYGGQFFKPYGKPAVFGISAKFKMKLAKEVTIRGPGGVLIERGYPAYKKLFDKGPIKLATAWTPGYKTEVEHIISDTLKRKTKFIPADPYKKYYFKWKGIRVPIDRYTAYTQRKEALMTISPPGQISLPKLYSYYEIPKSFPITTPGSLALASSYSLSKYYKTLSSYGYKSSGISRILKSYVSKPSGYVSTAYKYSGYKPSKVSRVSYVKPSYISKPSYVSPSYISRPSYVTRVGRGIMRPPPFVPPPLLPKFKFPKGKLFGKQLAVKGWVVTNPLKFMGFRKKKLGKII